jgi:hypothetical protein
VDDATFKTRLDELFLQFPSSGVAKKAAASHLKEVSVFVQTIAAAGERGENPASFALNAPSFPEAGKGGSVPSDTIPTRAYNWCVSPLTPMSVAGVIWVPSENNLGEDPADYAAELEIYAKSLPSTHDQDDVQFLFAQPADSLVEGITAPRIPDANSVSFDQWPKSLKSIAVALAELTE